MADFESNHLFFQEQLSERTTQVRNHIQSHFNLINQVLVSLNVHPEGAGFIRISTVIPDSYPWQGTYFNGIPVKIEAVANSPYTFINWADNPLIGDTLNPVFNGLLNAESITFEAYFADITGINNASPENPSFTIYPNPAKEYLELTMNDITSENLQYQILDVNGITVKEGLLAETKNRVRITLQDLRPSAYFLKISTDGEVLFNQKFIKVTD